MGAILAAPLVWELASLDIQKVLLPWLGLSVEGEARAKACLPVVQGWDVCARLLPPAFLEMHLLLSALVVGRAGHLLDIESLCVFDPIQDWLHHTQKLKDDRRRVRDKTSTLYILTELWVPGSYSACEPQVCSMETSVIS